MRKFIRISVLVLALAIPAFADNIPNGVTGNIPNGTTATGNIPNNATGDIPNGSTSSTIIEVLLSLFSLV
jgi:hypothetical protein